MRRLFALFFPTTKEYSAGRVKAHFGFHLPWENLIYAIGGTKRGKIMVVEDNHAVTRALATLLRDQGYSPIVFDRGLSAIQYAIEEGQPLDAALIDIHLPDISGLDVIQQLRVKLGNDTPIIILSGDNSMETLRLLPQVGATYFFSKPVNATTLLSQLKTWLA